MKRIGMTLAALVAMILTTAAQSCPDNNHPHAIDLGLKVKWACCNLGEKGYAGNTHFYAWGEKSTKSRGYDFNGYAFGGNYREPNSCRPIGMNISGGQYDAAKKVWGGSWRMPTKDDFEQLHQLGGLALQVSA